MSINSKPGTAVHPIPKYAFENEPCPDTYLTRMYNLYKRDNMSTVIKFLVACLICVTVATAVVYAVKWLW